MSRAHVLHGVFSNMGYNERMLPEVSLVGLAIILVSIIVSMGIHEAMHAFVAHRLGDTTAVEEGRLTLNPLKHIDLFTTVLFPMVLILLNLSPIFVARPVPLNPDRIRYDEFGVAIVGLAGPFTNLALAFFVSPILHATPIGSFAYYVALLFIQVNIGFFVFNMLPIPPLDGSRLLYAFAPDPLRQVMAAIERAGFFMIIAILLLLLPILGPALVNINRWLLNFLVNIW